MKRMMIAMVAAACLSAPAGELKLRTVYSDHMLFQRDKPVVLLGRADAGSEVLATMDGKRCAERHHQLRAQAAGCALSLFPSVAALTGAVLMMYNVRVF